MELAIIIMIPVVTLFLFYDLCKLGLIPKLLGLWHPINEIEDILIKDNVHFVYTDMTIKRFGSGFAMGQKPEFLILTKDYFVVGARVYSYVNKFKTDSIYECSFEKLVIYTKITVLLTVDGENNYIHFKTKYPKIWVDEFEKMGITIQYKPATPRIVWW